MARKTIRQKLAEVKRKFPLRTSYGFIYKNKGDTSRRFTTIFVYALVFDSDRGHSIFVWNPHRRHHNWTARDWNAWLNERGLNILAGDVLYSINVKLGSNWEMRRFIAFHGEYPAPIHVVGECKNAIYKGEINSKHLRRNKTNDTR